MIHSELLGGRLDITAIFLKGEMQMRSGGQPGGSHPAYDLPHMHPSALTHFRADTRHMPIDAGHATLMLDTNRVAEFPGPSRLLYLAVRHRLHGGAILRHQVDADVRAIHVQERMIAMEREA